MFYSSFYLYLIFALYIFFGVESYVPVGRLGHSSVLVRDKIYYYGGITDIGASDDAFYLDLSQSFNTANPPWTQITNIPFGSSWATVALDNSNNADMYLFGGLTRNVNTQRNSYFPFVYKFNANSLTWNTPTVNGTAPQGRIEMKAISVNSGKIYILGGLTDYSIDVLNRTFFSDMLTFNIADSSWSTNTAIERATYSATLLSNGIIVYVGGFEPFNGNNNIIRIVDISQILLFDTNSLTWSTKSARINASIPVENRQRHSAVLAPNDQIIIYGGSNAHNNAAFSQVSPDVLVIDTRMDPFEITAPEISTNIGKLPSLTAHTANLYGNYMIVAFGNITQKNADPPGRNDKIYVMDIRNFTWVNILDLSQASDNRRKAIIIASVFGVLGSGIVLIGAFFAYRWVNKKKQEKEAPGFFGSSIDSNEENVSGFFAYRWINKKKQSAPGFFGSNVDRNEYDVSISGTPADRFGESKVQIK